MNFDVSKIKVVFFDIGGVFLTNGWGHKSRQKSSGHFRFDYDEMNELHNFIYNVFEIGSISIDQYLDTVVFHRPRDFTKAESKDFMYAQSEELPHMLSWVKNWKTQIGLPIFAINKESKELNDYRIKKFKLHEIFDGFFSSCYLGVRKPNPRIFREAMQITQVNPSECVYFDDRELLANTSKKMGMIAIHHQSFEKSKEILENLIRKK